jgi:GNAT superfamily N-acetyltransferase
MTDQTIRLATPEDWLVIQAIVQSAYAIHAARIGRKPGPMTDDYMALIHRKCVYVLDSRGTIEGILVLICEEGAMLLDNVAVRPAMQKLGYGRALLKFAEQTAREAGYGLIRLYTNVAMTENIALYSRIGFIATHRAEDQGLQRVYMNKRLA